MKGHGLALKMRWPTVVILLAVLAAHGVILRFASAHFALSATAVAAVAALIVLKHLGALGAIWGWARRRSKKSPSSRAGHVGEN